MTTRDRLVRGAVVVLATLPPYNRHFLHDAAMFSIGLGARLLA
jgi:hypothetical protein